MKKIIPLFIIVLLISACTGNRPAKVEKLKSPEMAIADSIAKAEVKTTRNAIRHTIQNQSKLKASTPLTDKEKKKRLNLRRAHTAFKTGLNAYNKGDIETATEKFRECLSYDPENAIANYNLGKIYYDQKQPDLALSYFKSAVSANPKDSASMISVGLIYFNKNDFNQAESWYNKAIAIAPYYGQAYFNRGTLYGTHKYYSKSKDDLLKAVQYDPQNSEAYVNLGLAYFYMKDRNSACKAWHKAAKMGNPKGKQAVKAYCQKKK